MELTLEAYNNIFIEKKLFKVYPELENETRDYLKLLQNSSKIKESYVTSFEIPIYTGFFNEEYLLKWNIQEILENENIPSQKIQIDNPSIWSCPSRLNQFKLFQMNLVPDIEKPIVLAHHSAIQKLIVIDGNHRFHIAKKRNRKTIDAIVLHPNTHLNYMNEENRNQFKIHHNLFVLNNYSEFPLMRKCTVSKDFKNRSLYPILDKNYVFSTFRNLKYIVMKSSLWSIK